MATYLKLKTAVRHRKQLPLLQRLTSTRCVPSALRIATTTEISGLAIKEVEMR